MPKTANAMEWELHKPQKQAVLSSDPYDRWVSPGGVCMAEFRRIPDDTEGYLIRFPGQADFRIIGPTSEEPRIEGWPALGFDDLTHVQNLFHNAILPIIGNYTGGLFLHGSAVLVDSKQVGVASGAIAFLGLSRGGKTTLAGAFAKAGFPFLTEDVIDLDLKGGGYQLQPKRSKLRLFADSARHLFGDATTITDENRKQNLEAADTLPFANSPAPLRQIYVLGTDHSAPLAIRRLSQSEALSSLMPHAFILDVDDKPRLREHFSRMADLSQDIGCYALDYRRDYAELPSVCAAVLANFRSQE